MGGRCQEEQFEWRSCIIKHKLSKKVWDFPFFLIKIGLKVNKHWIILLVLNMQLYADGVVVLILIYVIKVRCLLFLLVYFIWGSLFTFKISSAVKDNFLKRCNRYNSAWYMKRGKTLSLLNSGYCMTVLEVLDCCP